jgi:hypothetical protein
MMVYFSSYIPFYAWIVAPLFKLLKKGTPWMWGPLEQEAFDLSKEVLINAPIRAYVLRFGNLNLWGKNTRFWREI